MDWGDTPAWAAFVISAAALGVAIKTRGDGKRSADASETAAAASVRSADVAEAALADQRRMEAEQRAAEAEAARPRVRLAVEFVGAYRYRLKNDGNAPAANVSFREDGLPYLFQLRGREGLSLSAGEAIDFQMRGAAGSPVPAQLFAKWDGQEEHLPLRVPPRR
ncbi:hypothetical protein [Streptomyces sp. NPDC056169]|uniref:hypothetical protein n=1 Tax=Streptomyces sp. NPDC056169 TaxID=3345734 RepID=UPI0035DE053F